jgi:hypothetical protein
MTWRAITARPYLKVFVEPVPPDTGVGRRILQGVFG